MEEDLHRQSAVAWLRTFMIRVSIELTRGMKLREWRHCLYMLRLHVLASELPVDVSRTASRVSEF